MWWFKERLQCRFQASTSKLWGCRVECNARVLHFYLSSRSGWGRSGRLPDAFRELSQFNISSWWGPVVWEGSAVKSNAERTFIPEGMSARERRGEGGRWRRQKGVRVTWKWKTNRNWCLELEDDDSARGRRTDSSEMNESNLSHNKTSIASVFSPSLCVFHLVIALKKPGECCRPWFFVLDE